MFRILCFALIALAILEPGSAAAGARDDQRLITGARGKIMPVVAGAIQAGANLEARDEIGRTALMWSAFHGHSPMLEYLIDQGADVNARDKDERTVLIWAAIAGRAVVVEILLANGADASLADVDGKTAAAHAVAEGHTALGQRLAE